MIALLIIAYNEAEYIDKVINQWKGLVDYITVLIPVKPWRGLPQEDDGTAINARRAGAEVIIQHWNTEEEQRSWGCARLYDYDYVLTLDADEFFTLEDRKKILAELKDEPCYRAENMVTYWKDNYILDPPDTHKPVIAVDPKRIKFWEARMPMLMKENTYTDWQPVIDVTMHHFSWSKPDHKIKAKIENFSHSNIIKPNWYNDIWLGWDKNKELDDLRPYGIEKSRAILYSMPQEIKNLIK
jgi:hypothetical protein